MDNNIKDIFNNTDDETRKFTQEEIASGKILACASYLGFVSIIIYFGVSNNYSKYHAKQGLNLFILESIVSIISTAMEFSIIISLFTFILSIILIIFGFIGIYYAAKGYAKKLPFIDRFSLMK